MFNEDVSDSRGVMIAQTQMHKHIRRLGMALPCLGLIFAPCKFGTSDSRSIAAVPPRC